MRRKKKNLKIILSSLFMLGGIFVLSQLVSLSDVATSLGITFTKHEIATTEHGWNLILVNDDYYMPDVYEVTLKTLANGEQIDERIYPELQAMFDDARATGLGLYVASGYRTAEEQKELMNERVKRYMSQGYLRGKAEKMAKQWVAEPGTSEHQLGIAVDINADVSVSSSEEVYGWLEDNSYKYGFIQRYPSDKVDITGISHEPWHYRYVGKDAAKEIFEQGVCLEEYVGDLENSR